jgi:lipopolysaccharide biosynthesis glycosyltransferase
MGNNCVVLVTDINYINHIKYMIMQIRDVGKWQGDICVIMNNITDKSIIDDFKSRSIYILNVNIKNNYYSKYNIFSVYFKKWDNVLYFDADFVLRNDINKLVSQINSDTIFLCDFEEIYLDQCIKDITMIKKYNLKKIKVFNSGCLLFSTTIVNKNTMRELVLLSEELDNFNKHGDSENGGDQPILNLFFKDIAKQINYVKFHLRAKNDTIALHTCRWHAPWKDKRYVNNYKKYLNMW